jgi:hypothetical protein
MSTVIKKSTITEAYKIDTEGRTEFTFFEACILILRREWNSSEFTVKDEYFYGVASWGDEIGWMEFDYHQPKNFFSAIEEFYDKHFVSDLEHSLGSYWGGDYFAYSGENGDEDWDSGHIINSLDETAFAALLAYYAARNFFGYQKVKRQPKEAQVRALLGFFDRKKNKYDKKMIEDLINEYCLAMDNAYHTGFRNAITEEYCDLSDYGIEVRVCMERFRVTDFGNMVYLIWTNNLPKDITFGGFLKYLYELKDTRWGGEIREGVFEHFDREEFNNSGFQTTAFSIIDERFSAFRDEEEEPERAAAMDNAVKELEKMGVEFGEWVDNNVTPDKKFKFCITDIDKENGKFHVRLWDINRHKSVAGYMSLDGVKALASVPTLFDAEEMLNEALYGDTLPLPDRMRLTLLEGAFLEKSCKVAVQVQQLQETPVAYRRSPKVVEYNELWTPKDISALRSQAEFAALPTKELFEQFIHERLGKSLNMLFCEILDYSVEPVENNDLDYDWWMRVYIKKR